MLELKNISISLMQNNRKIIENFSFTLNRGEKAAIIGEEGNGKSTLLKMIQDCRLISSYAEYSGEIIKKGIVGYLPQIIDRKDLNKTASEYLGEDEHRTYGRLFFELGLNFELIRGQQIKTMSGGERVKLQLAKILVNNPDILLLDEPTNDIDINTLKWLENFINKTRLPILLVSHDETLIERTANIIIHMEQLIKKSQCRISVTHASYAEYLAARQTKFLKQQQIAAKQRANYDRQIEKWQQIYNRVNYEQKNISRQDPHGGRLIKKKMKSVKSQQKRLENSTETFIDFPEEEAAIIIEFSKDVYIPNQKIVLDFTLDKLRIGGKILANDIKLCLTGGEHVGIIGSNGAGKSTLLSKLWKDVKDRRDIKAAYMPQDYSKSLDYEITPIEYLAQNFTKEEITRARTFMGSMKFTHEEMRSKIGSLSGGQRAKILFLEMVLKNANLLLLDEPTRNFSPLSNPVIRRALKDFRGAIISISHDRKYLNEVCNKIYRLDKNGLTAVSLKDFIDR